MELGGGGGGEATTTTTTTTTQRMPITISLCIVVSNGRQAADACGNKISIY